MTTGTMIKGKRCKKCGGNLSLEEDDYGFAFSHCLQCSQEKYFSKKMKPLTKNYRRKKKCQT